MLSRTLLAVVGLSISTSCLESKSTEPAASGTPPLSDRMVAAHFMYSQMPDFYPKGMPSRQCDVIGRPVAGQVIWSDPAAAFRWDVEQAKASGIDAFAMWLHPRFGEPSSDYDQRAQLRVEALFTEMQKAGGLKFYPDFWWYRMDPQNWGVVWPAWKREPEPGVEAEMRRYGKILRSWSERFSDVWAKKEGRLIVGMQDHELFENVPYAKAMEWLFGPMGGRGKIYLVLSRYPTNGEIAADWLAGADALFDWDANRSYGDSVRELPAGKVYAQAHSKKWWPSFAPAFFVSRTGDGTAPRTPTLYERLGVIAYRRAWLDAIEGKVPAVYLITWNDVSEDSEIMPTAGHGYAIQRLTRYFSRWYHQGGQPDIQQEELLLFHHPQVASGLQLPVGRLPAKGLDLALTPPTDYVTLCSFLKAPAEVSVIFHKKVIATQELPAGFHTWLLYHPTSALSDAILPVYPKSEEGLSVTVLTDPFTDMEISVRVRRKDVDLGRFFSHQPIVDAAGRADMGTVGDVFTLVPR